MKKTTKTVLILALTLALLMSLAACGKAEETEAVSTEPPVIVEDNSADVAESEADVEVVEETVQEVAIPMDTPVPTADPAGNLTYTSMSKGFSFKYSSDYIAMSNSADNAVVYAAGDVELPYCTVALFSDIEAVDYLNQLAAAAEEELGKSLVTAPGEPAATTFGTRDISYIYYTYTNDDIGGTVACAFYAENLDDGSVVVYNSLALQEDTAAVDSILQLAIETFTLN